MEEPEIHLMRYRDHGEDRDFARFVAGRTDLVWSIALRKLGGCRALAEEVVQTVFADVVGRVRTLDLSKPLTAWLIRHTQLKAAELARKERRRSRREERYGEDWRMTAEDPAPADSTSSEAARVMDQLLLTMSEQDRRALVLRYYEKRALEEVADCMGSTTEAVRKRISRALDAVRLKLSKRGITSSTALLSTALVAGTVQAAPAGTATAAASYGLAQGGAAAASWLADLFTTVRSSFRASHAAAALAGGAAVAATVPLWHHPAPPSPPAMVASAPKGSPGTHPSAPGTSSTIPISTKSPTRTAAARKSPTPMGFPGMMGGEAARRELVRRWKEPLQLSAEEEQSLDKWLTARMDELQTQTRELMASPGVLMQLLREGEPGSPAADEQLRALMKRPSADAVETWATAHLDEARMNIIRERQKSLRETEAEALATRMMTEIDRSAKLDEEQKNAVFHFYHDSALSRAELLEEEWLAMIKPPTDLPAAPSQTETAFLQATLRPEQNAAVAETKRAAGEMFEKAAEEMGKIMR